MALSVENPPVTVLFHQKIINGILLFFHKFCGIEANLFVFTGNGFYFLYRIGLNAPKPVFILKQGDLFTITLHLDTLDALIRLQRICPQFDGLFFKSEADFCLSTLYIGYAAYAELCVLYPATYGKALLKFRRQGIFLKGRSLRVSPFNESLDKPGVR